MSRSIHCKTVEMKATFWNIFTFIILLQHASSYANRIEPQNTRHRAIIVGAGLAGYSAAAKLLENEFDDILVLEAENRTGGRVHTVPLHGDRIDMGAQWLHGQGGNIIYEMIGTNFTFGDSTFENATYYFSQSNGVPENQNQINQLALLSEEIMDVVYDPNYFGTFGSFFVNRYWAQLRATAYNSIPWRLCLQVQNFFHTYINNYFGTESWFDISIEVYSTHNDTTGSQWVTWRNEGFSTVFEFLSRKRPDPAYHLDVESKILLNKEVENIDWDGDVINLHCTDDTTYSADYVIFTGSLGVLKHRHDTLFTPELPDRKISAIEHSEYGSLEKIFLEFSAPFWDTSENFAQFSILWTQEDVMELLGTPQEWLINIAYFRRVDAFPNLLGTFFIGARIPDFDSFNETRIITDCQWLLSRITRQTVPQPINVLRSDWITQRNFRGSYSVFTMNSAHHGASPSVLAEPVHDSNGRPRIFFAGEHTSAEFSGYSNGAVETGYRAAEEVLERPSSGTKITSQYPILLIFVVYFVKYLAL
ncbi:protein anon-37Cs-like [Bradysia coprophila]|uniref:protein anon-37Cs-like n=1 Tax=Bradysia coprophila TaxID=38358 RepID=UPI00187DAF7F|nr:protein anon-37Cs-like [Bradysia coprophila]